MTKTCYKCTSNPSSLLISNTIDEVIEYISQHDFHLLPKNDPISYYKTHNSIKITNNNYELNYTI
jgi:hypothetical protein